MKKHTLEKLTDKYIGKEGSTERNNFNLKLKKELEMYNISKEDIIIKKGKCEDFTISIKSIGEIGIWFPELNKVCFKEEIEPNGKILECYSKEDVYSKIVTYINKYIT